MVEENDKLVNFFMRKDLKTELDILSKREGRSLKEIFNEVIEDYVKAHKEGNPQHLMESFIENEDFVGFPSVAIDFEKKKAYIEKNCQVDGRLTDFGKELLGHVTQYYSVLMKL
jgi:hypothetical protein